MPWATAKVNGVVIAETEFPQVVSGDVYFPPECVKWEYLSCSSGQKRKGAQLQFTVSVNGTIIPEAAWSHHEPQNRKLEPVKDHVAFVGMAPVMLIYKKNFRYARSDDRSDTSSIHTSGSTPNTSTPTTPTYSYAIPTFQFSYNPAIYDYRNSSANVYTPPMHRSSSYCSALAGWKEKMLPSVPEVEGCMGSLEIADNR